MKRPRLPFSFSERRALLIFLDIILINSSVLLGLWTWKLSDGTPFTLTFVMQQIQWFPILSVLWLTSGILTSSYDNEVTSHIRSTLKAIVELTAILLAVYLALYFLSSPGSLPRRFVLFFIVISFVVLGSWRFLFARYFGSKLFQRRAIIVGGGSLSNAELTNVIRRYAFPHYQIIGSVSDHVSSNGSAGDMPVLGDTSKLLEIAQNTGVSEIIVTSMDHTDSSLVRNIVACQEQGIQITPLPVIYETLMSRIPLKMVSEGWLEVLPLRHASTGVLFPLFKRTVDVTLSLIGLGILAVLMPIVALAIKIDSRGPVFYRQERVGRGGRLFTAFKFRSMEEASPDENHPLWTEPKDPRVTGVGKILRATHIDEFPQFLNILKGDMSAVGPRPERKELADQFEQAIPFYRLRHSVRPGMAGWALVKQGNTSSVEDAGIKLEYDLYYIKHQSVVLDIVILLKTFVDAITLRGR